MCFLHNKVDILITFIHANDIIIFINITIRIIKLGNHIFNWRTYLNQQNFHWNLYTNLEKLKYNTKMNKPRLLHFVADRFWNITLSNSSVISSILILIDVFTCISCFYCDYMLEWRYFYVKLNEGNVW